MDEDALKLFGNYRKEMISIRVIKGCIFELDPKGHKDLDVPRLEELQVVKAIPRGSKNVNKVECCIPELLQ